MTIEVSTTMVDLEAAPGSKGEGFSMDWIGLSCVPSAVSSFNLVGFGFGSHRV